MKGQTVRIFTYNKKFSFSTLSLYENIVNRFFFHAKGKEIGKDKPKIFLANVLLCNISLSEDESKPKSFQTE